MPRSEVLAVKPELDEKPRAKRAPPRSLTRAPVAPSPTTEQPLRVVIAPEIRKGCPWPIIVALHPQFSGHHLRLAMDASCDSSAGATSMF